MRFGFEPRSDKCVTISKSPSSLSYKRHALTQWFVRLVLKRWKWFNDINTVLGWGLNNYPMFTVWDKLLDWFGFLTCLETKVIT